MIRVRRTQPSGRSHRLIQLLEESDGPWQAENRELRHDSRGKARNARPVSNGSSRPAGGRADPSTGRRHAVPELLSGADRSTAIRATW